jgi:hypothetical protein
MPIQNKKRKAGDDNSEPGSDQPGESEGVLTGQKQQKIEVELVHIFRTKPENLPYIWDSFLNWLKEWEN